MVETADGSPVATGNEKVAGRLLTIQEGLARILVPAEAATSLDPKGNKENTIPQSVFYNPIQQFNRDLSVIAILVFGEDRIALKQSKGRPRPNQRRRKWDAITDSDKLQNLNDKTASSTKDDGIRRGKKQKPNWPTSNDYREGNLPLTENALSNDISSESAAASEATGVECHTDSQDINTDSNIKVTEKNAAHPQSKVGESKSKEEIKLSNPQFKILDALSATGLRALRYAKEIPFATSVTANDLSPAATRSILANVKYNDLEEKIKVVTGNALSLMYDLAGQNWDDVRAREKRYDVIDLDPYGTAVPFLDAALHATNDGGLLCVTCTDAGVFASVGYPEKTYALYGGTPIKGLHSHEGGLRLILHAIASSAARYGITIEPLLSLSIDYYARIFVRVHRSPAQLKLLASKTMLVYSCDAGCGAWKTQFMAKAQRKTAKDGSTTYKHSLAQAPTAAPTCEHCGFKTHISGPMYGGPLHNVKFLQRILSRLPDLDDVTYATKNRIEGMLSTALEETELLDYSNPTVPQESTPIPESARPVPPLDPAMVDNHPFFFIPSALARVLHCQAPSEAAVKGALRHAGYRALRSHAKPGTIRTDAPWTFVWEMMREWIKQKAPIKEGAIRPGTAGWAIMTNSAPEHGAETPADRDSRASAQSEVDQPLEGVSDGSGVSTPKIVFDEKLGKEPASRKRLVRYQTNPRANWGPMNKAKGKSTGPTQG